MAGQNAITGSGSSALDQNYNSGYINSDGFIILHTFLDTAPGDVSAPASTTNEICTNSELKEFLTSPNSGIVFDPYGNLWSLQNLDFSSTIPTYSYNLIWVNPFVSPSVNNQAFESTWIGSSLFKSYICGNGANNPFYSLTKVMYPKYFVSAPNANGTIGGWLLEQINGQSDTPQYKLLYNPLNREETLGVDGLPSLYQRYCNTIQFQDRACYCPNMGAFSNQQDLVDTTSENPVYADYCLYSWLSDGNIKNSEITGRTLGKALFNAFETQRSQSSGDFVSQFQQFEPVCSCGGFCNQLTNQNLGSLGNSIFDKLYNPSTCSSPIKNITMTTCLANIGTGQGTTNIAGNINVVSNCPTTSGVSTGSNVGSVPSTNASSVPSTNIPTMPSVPSRKTTPSKASTSVAQPSGQTLMDKIKEHKVIVIGATVTILLLLIVVFYII